MRLGMFSRGGSPRSGLVVDAGVIDISLRLPDVPTQLIDIVAGWKELQQRVAGIAFAQPDFGLRDVKLCAPVSRPGKIFAIGLNYADHCAEAGLDTPKEQIWFTKAATSVNGPYDPIELPAVSQQLDHECELVAVIGKRCRNVPKARASEVVFGYCVGNDVSVRDWQLRTGQWSLGKSFDTHAPIGPWLTTADTVDPHRLNIRCAVNGTVRQESNTRHLIFNVYDQIAQLSQAMTLEPGDLIFTGTCGGVGIGRKPPSFLKEGDSVQVEIESLGEINNRVVTGPSAAQLG